MLLAIRHRLEFLAFQVIVCIVDCLPPRTTAGMAKSLATLIHYGLPRKWTRYHVASTNLRNAFGDHYSEKVIDILVYRMWIHLFRMVAEIIQAPRKLHLHSYRRIIHFNDGFNKAVEAMCSGRRVINLGGHFGNWEVGTSLFGLWGFPMGIVARELDNPYLHDWFRQYRELTGHRLMMKQGGYDEMVALLQNGGNLGLLCDQDAGPRGLFVNFFGRPASAFKSIALLALEFDALIVVGYSVRNDNEYTTEGCHRFTVGCEAVIDPCQVSTADPVGEITQLYTDALERAIRRVPEQYFWVHRRWKSEPKSRKKAEPQRKAG